MANITVIAIVFLIVKSDSLLFLLCVRYNILEATNYTRISLNGKGSIEAENNMQAQIVRRKKAYS